MRRVNLDVLSKHFYMDMEKGRYVIYEQTMEGNRIINSKPIYCDSMEECLSTAITMFRVEAKKQIDMNDRLLLEINLANKLVKRRKKK